MKRNHPLIKSCEFTQYPINKCLLFNCCFLFLQGSILIQILGRDFEPRGLKFSVVILFFHIFLTKSLSNCRALPRQNSNVSFTQVYTAKQTSWAREFVLPRNFAQLAWWANFYALFEYRSVILDESSIECAWGKEMEQGYAWIQKQFSSLP